MKIKTDNLNKVVYLEKLHFSNASILFETVNDILNNNLFDYKIVILERGESLASCFELYSRFHYLLSTNNLTNKVYIFTETEVEEYYSFIRNKFGWECVFLTAFYDSPNIYLNEYKIDFEPSIHIHRWQLDYKIPIEKKIKKHFLTLNRSYRSKSHWYRKELYKFMNDIDIMNKSYASFRFIKEFDNNFNEPINHIDDINNKHNLYTQIDLKELYNSAFITLLTESNSEPTLKVRLLNDMAVFSDEMFEFRNDYLTEKTSRNLILGMPFIMLGPAHSLDRLHKMGFKTFDGFINESYDRESDQNVRMELIKEEIFKISKLSTNYLENIYKELYPILLHNKNNIKNIQDNNAKKIQNIWK